MDFENRIKEFRDIIPFKDTIDIDDIVLFVLPDIYFYGIVKKIERDNSKKIDWWHITWMTFTIPISKMVLILRNEQMTGKEEFTIDGQYRFFTPINTNMFEGLEEEEIKKPKVTKTKLTLIKKKEK